ncbi:MAG TPA: VOC family protein [Acidobacteriota bacterium]|nr:VOC family protein [Acidobacteriota bacterium]HNG94584.1 VOC family protein [Acidobacteriota bacterium]HNJ43158.1 VOC family protein [Acidobacteriota bacterium]
MPHFFQVTPRVPVTDLRRTIDFYTQTLGFTEDVVWPEDQPTFCILTRDTVSLGFFVPDGCRSDTKPGTCDLYIEVDGAQELHAELKDKLTIEWGPEVYAYGRREFAFRDPDGYLIIVTEETDDPPTCQVD